MIRKPFFLFILIVGGLIAGLLWFTQTPSFANALKSLVSQSLPRELGLEVDFSEIQVQFFPPGFSIHQPKVVLHTRKIQPLEAGTELQADRMDFSFHPFQIFSGHVRVHTVTLIQGKIHLKLASQLPSAHRTPVLTPSFGIHWDELFQVRAESVLLKDTRLQLSFQDSGETAQAQIPHLELAQWSGKGGLGYFLDFKLLDLHQKGFSQKLSAWVPEQVEVLEGRAFVNALGLTVEQVNLAQRGASLQAQLQVKGNVFESKSLPAEGEVRLQGDFPSCLHGLSPDQLEKLKLKGQGSISSRFQLNLKDPLTTLRAELEGELQDPSIQGFTLGSLQMRGAWESNAQGGQLSVEKLIASAPITERAGGSQPGGGGKIQLGPVKWVWGSSAPILLPLSFEKAHLHWLAQPALKSIYPLDFRLTGSVLTTVVPPTATRGWEVSASLDAALENFSLDNQRWGVSKPLKRVFHLPSIRLRGGLWVDSRAVRAQNLQVSLPHTSLNLSGKVDFKAGYDLRALGNVDLADLGQIAENPIEGQGTLALQVVGPSSHVLVDMDVDAKNASYLGLHLGNVQGKILWDDGKNALVFQKAVLTKAQSQFTVDGDLDFSHDNQAHLQVNVHPGDVKDLIDVFRGLTDPLGWFPHDLNGSTQGWIRVNGGLRLSEIQIQSELQGSNWETWGERFQTVFLAGGFDRGKYELSQVQLKKRSGLISGRISYSEHQGYDWKLETQAFSLNDLDYIAQLNVPIRGKLQVATQGQGLGAQITSSTEVQLSEFKVRGRLAPESQFSLTTKNGSIHSSAQIMGDQGVFESQYDFNSKEWSSVLLRLNRLDFSPILMLFNSKSIQDPRLLGYLSGALELKFHSGQSEKANGSFSISEYELGRSDTKFELIRPIQAKVSQGSFQIPDLGIHGKGGDTHLQLSSTEGVLKGAITGELDLSFSQFFSSTLAYASGLSQLDLKVLGTLKEPKINGSIGFSGGTLRLASLETSLENVTGQFQIQDGQIQIPNLQADLGEGKISVLGQILLHVDRYPELDLKAMASGAKLKVFPFQLAKINSEMNVRGTSPPYLVDGAVKVVSAISKEKFLGSREKSAGTQALQYSPPPSRPSEGSFSKFKLNIDVQAPGGVMIQNDIFRDVEAKGSLKLVNLLESPGVVGNAEVLRGKLIFKHHVFTIHNAAAKFLNPNQLSPEFDLNASTDVNGTKIQMFASGKPDKIRIELTSTPALPESEILSLLAVGLTSNDAKRLSANDLSVVQQGEAASLVLHSLDFNRDLEDKTGFQVQVDESVNPQQGISAFKPQSQTDALVAPKIGLRRRLGDRLSLSAGSTIGIGSIANQQVNLDFSVTPDVSISGVYNNYGSYTSTTTQTNANPNTLGTQTSTNPNSLGLDLKFQKRFK
ncbi:MAG: translocation/assembly module TamB domain-containing protein [Bdellovibrionia bacterium]